MSARRLAAATGHSETWVRSRLALLTLPAATAGHHLRRLGPIMIVSVGLCAVLTTIPRMAVYGTRISPESAIVIAAAGVYLASLAVRRLRRGPA